MVITGLVAKVVYSMSVQVAATGRTSVSYDIIVPPGKAIWNTVVDLIMHRPVPVWSTGIKTVASAVY